MHDIATQSRSTLKKGLCFKRSSIYDVEHVEIGNKLTSLEEDVGWFNRLSRISHDLERTCSYSKETRVPEKGTRLNACPIFKGLEERSRLYGGRNDVGCRRFKPKGPRKFSRLKVYCLL
jgi:hypothetical protein